MKSGWLLISLLQDKDEDYRSTGYFMSFYNYQQLKMNLWSKNKVSLQRRLILILVIVQN